jgi:thioredoxin 2
MHEDTTIIRCAECGAKNRIPIARLADGPVCGKCRTPLKPESMNEHPVTITDHTFDREVIDSPIPVLVDCWAPWCGPCQMIAPILEELATEYKGRIKIAKLNVDENPHTASQFQTRSIPTMLIFNNGTLVDRLVGALPKTTIRQHLSAVL